MGFLRERDYAKEAEAHAHEITLRAERKLGELLEKTPMNVGAKGSLVTGNKRVPVKDTTPTLSDLGLTKRESVEAKEGKRPDPLRGYGEAKGPQTKISGWQ